MIIGTIHLNADCTIDGAAPMLSPGTTHAAYPVKFTIVDASGIVAGPFDLVLEVVKAEAQGQGQQGGVQQNNPNLPVLNLPTQLPPAYGGKNYSYAPLYGGGTGPYWFSIEQSLPPLLYQEWANGTITGRADRHDEDTKYDFSICVHDSMGAVACGNTSLTVISTKETWTGTLQTSRPMCGYEPSGSHGGWAYESSLSGSWTTTFTVPSSLVESLAAPKDYIYFVYTATSGIWSGSESSTRQCSSKQVTGGSVSDVPIYAYVEDGIIRLINKDSGNWLLPGGVAYPDGIAEQELEISLVPTSVSNTTISGTILLIYPRQNATGTFALTRVK